MVDLLQTAALVSSRRVILTATAALAAAACQSSSTTSAPATGSATAVPEIVIRDAGATVVARVSARQPCRATIDGRELIVGVAPMVAQVGTTRWTGETGPNGTTFKRAGKTVARMFAASASELAIVDPEGIAQIRAARSADADSSVNVADRGGAIIRIATRTADGGFAVTPSAGGPVVTATGTDDALLVALLSAPEVLPEVRALAACRRLFPEPKV